MAGALHRILHTNSSEHAAAVYVDFSDSFNPSDDPEVFKRYIAKFNFNAAADTAETIKNIVTEAFQLDKRHIGLACHVTIPTGSLAEITAGARGEEEAPYWREISGEQTVLTAPSAGFLKRLFTPAPPPQKKYEIVLKIFRKCPNTFPGYECLSCARLKSLTFIRLT